MSDPSSSVALVRRGRGTPEATAGGRREFEGVRGSPLTYESAQFLMAHALPLVPQSTRDWVADRAGAPVRCPVHGHSAPYLFCSVEATTERGGGAGLAAGAQAADYELFSFGRGGLAVAEGTTEHFVATPGGSRWRSGRWDLPVDPTSVRNGHGRGLAAGTLGSLAPLADDGPAALPRTGTAGTGPTVAEILPDDIVADFGNLPLDTQRFLVDPFARSRRRPQAVAVRGITEATEAALTEALWVYLFNASSLAFAYLHRQVRWTGPPPSGGPESWMRGADADRLRAAPWDVAAWTAAVAVRDTASSSLVAPAPPDALGSASPSPRPKEIR